MNKKLDFELNLDKVEPCLLDTYLGYLPSYLSPPISTYLLTCLPILPTLLPKPPISTYLLTCLPRLPTLLPKPPISTYLLICLFKLPTYIAWMSYLVISWTLLGISWDQGHFGQKKFKSKPTRHPMKEIIVKSPKKTMVFKTLLKTHSSQIPSLYIILTRTTVPLWISTIDSPLGRPLGSS